jgi:two-component system, LytTR family, response regulator
VSWTAVIVDDEPLARRELRTLLAVHERVQVVGEASSVSGAAERIRLTGANLVFLDIQLKGESGFDLLPQLTKDVAVIFVTAHDQFAVRAFSVHAHDYLLKPVIAERLAAAIAFLGERSPQRLFGAAAGVGEAFQSEEAQRQEADAQTPLSWSSRLFLRLDEQMGFLAVSQIRAVFADGDQACVLMHDGRRVRVRKPLREWVQRLPTQHFLQIHRGTLINLNDVLRVEAWSHGSYLVYLRGESEPLIMSRRFSTRVRARLG